MSIIDQTSTTLEPGAPAAGDTVPLCVPDIRGNEWQYIRECLDTNWVSSVGRFVNRFEELIADYVGARYSVAVVNGTAALHVALLVAGVESGDEVLVSDLTFIAPVNAIRYVGAWPVFVDVEPEHWQMDPQKVRDFLEKECRCRNGGLYNKCTDRRVTAIVPVHVLGHPCDMDPIVQLAHKYGLVVVEDATESLGARYQGQLVGHLGDIACFSFNGNKIITTGGGGMIVTDRQDWASRAKYLTTQAKDDPLEYVHNSIGYNYRLTNLQAAMGCAQFEALSEHIDAKRAIADRYAKALAGLDGITHMPEASWASCVRWMYMVLIDPDRYGLTSRDLLTRLAEADIQTRPLWQPMHLSPAHSEAQRRQCEVAEHLWQRALSLPCSVGLAEKDQKRVIEGIVGSGK